MSRCQIARRRATGALGLSLALAAGCVSDTRDRMTSPEARPALASGHLQGALSSAPEALASPTRIAVTTQGRLLVSDAAEAKNLVGERDQGRVMTLDPVTLQPLSSFTVYGKPLAVAQGWGRTYVGNAVTRTVEVYRGDGRRFEDFGANAVGSPQDMVIDEVQQRVLVLDAESREVRIFDFRGTPLGSVGGTLGMKSPTAIGLDTARHEILVSDYGAPGGYASLWVIGYEGQLVKQISGRGTCGMLGCRNGFSRPQGVTVDARGRILLVDCLLAQVLVIDHDAGTVLGTIGTRDPGPQQLRLPLDVAADSSGDVYVTSSRAGRVVSFRGGAQP